MRARPVTVMTSNDFFVPSDSDMRGGVNDNTDNSLHSNSNAIIVIRRVSNAFDLIANIKTSVIMSIVFPSTYLQLVDTRPSGWMIMLE